MSGWWDSFRGRHPNITVHMGEGLGHARMVAFDTVIMDRYYDMLEATLKNNALWEMPAQIFNCDESGMPLNPGTGKVSAAKGAKHPYQVTSGNRAQLTVLVCTSAAGYAIPLMVTFDRRALKPELTIGEFPGTFYGLSISSWMDSDLFHQWFMNHFLRYTPACRPLLLLMDGQSAHYIPTSSSAHGCRGRHNSLLLAATHNPRCPTARQWSICNTQCIILSVEWVETLEWS